MRYNESMTRLEKIIFAVIVLTFAIGFTLYPQMPRWMASHWNAQGNPDGYTHKFWGLFSIPLMLAILYIVIRYVPGYEDHPFLEQARPYYDDFMLVLTVILAGVYLSAISWNLGARLMIGSGIAVCLGVAYHYLSRMVRRAKRNYVFGIRTPWTMTSKKVWEQTHHRAAALFNAAAILSFAGAFFPSAALYLSILPVIVFSIYLWGYSYALYSTGRSH